MDDFRCSVWTHDQGVDPVGSAPRFDRLLLVEVPLPWPKDVSEIPLLAPVVDTDPLTRVMAVVPATPADEATRVTVWAPAGGGGGLEGSESRVPAGDLAGVLEAVVRGAPLPDAQAAPPELLLCGHGRRDRCCGSLGTALQAEVAGARHDGVRVRRCSHTGGHRFAPTGITLPDGHAWAYLTPYLVDALLARSIEPAALHEHYRGATALDAHAQVVDRALFERYGWAWWDQRVSATSERDGDGTVVRVRWEGSLGAGEAEGRVVTGRRVPVLVCGEPPERATKTSDELVLAALHV